MKIVNLANARFKMYPVFVAILISILFVGPSVVNASSSITPTSVPVLHVSRVHSQVTLLDPSFDPNAAVGGVPFCSSGSLGTILCYPPSFLKKAYDFPGAGGPGNQGDQAVPSDQGGPGDQGDSNGQGQTIVIVDAFGSPTIQSDLNKFDATFGVPPATVTILCGPTWTGSPSDNCPVKTVADLSTATNAALCGAVGWAEETSLDVTMAHSLAPSAKIVLVVANDCFDTNLYGAEQAVVSQHKYDGSVMSQSFGEPDDLVTCTAVDPVTLQCTSRDPTILNLPNSVFEAAQDRQWTVIASSGDDGANEDARVLGTGELTPSFPATSPLVLAAGGTQGNPYGGQYGTFPGPGGTFSCAAHTNCNTGLVLINGGQNGCGTAARPGEPSSCFPTGYGGEATWNEFNAFGGLSGGGLGRSSGGGVSSLYPRPFYQFGTPSSYTTLFGSTVVATGRTTPDVSFNSAAQGGFIVYLGFLGAWGVFSGTSAASPAWAGIIALVDQANRGPAGFINPAIYQLGRNPFAGFFGGASFHDITVGENSDTAGTLSFVDGFVATRGYDLTTGWGTPDVSNFIHNILPLLGNH